MKDDPRDELIDMLTGRLSEYLTGADHCLPDALIRNALTAVIADWSVKRDRSTVRDDAGYQDGNDVCRESVGTVREGSVLEITTPWRPETDDERTEREAREAAQSWAWRAHQFSWDPQDLGYDDGQCPPPPERVGASQLLDQGLWWRARTNTDPDNRATEAIRLEDMTHDHRLALLGFLRRNAPRYKLRADWSYASVPGPQGDMATLAFEEECSRQWETSAAEWIEDQPLVQALVYWTTPVAESPLTWRPMNEAPRAVDAVIVVRYHSPDGEQTAQVTPSLSYEWVTLPDYEPLTVPDGHGGRSYAEPIEWRELRDDEQPTPIEPFDPNCPHGVPDDEHCCDCLDCIGEPH